MATAMELRAIHSAHEAGMHDRKPKPDVCKICARELKETEAQDMAKIPTYCTDCGGSYDGTPSGLMKHEATGKHREAVRLAIETEKIDEAVAQTAIDLSNAAADKVRAEAAVLDPAEPPAPQDELVAELSQLISSKEQELARRQVDHKWRVANRPDQADDYRDAKVAPLRLEIQLLRDVRSRIG